MNWISKIKDHWVESILATIIGCMAVYMQYQSRQHEIGGTLNASFQKRMLNSNDSLSVIVCMEDSVMEMTDLYLTPTFKNGAEYSIKDFYLNYEVNYENVELLPTSFVKSHQYGKSQRIYTYESNTLEPYNITKNPFSSYSVKNGYGHSNINVKAAYDGAESKFEYNVDVYYFVIANKSNNIEDWKEVCNKVIKKYGKNTIKNVYYCAKNRSPEYHFEVSLPIYEKNETNETISNLQENEKKNHEEQDNEIGLEIKSYSVNNTDSLKIDIILNKEIPNNLEACLFYLGVADDNSFWSKGVRPFTIYNKETNYSISFDKKVKSVKDVELFIKGELKDCIDKEIDKDYIKLTNKSKYTILALVYYKDSSYYWSLLIPTEVMKVDNGEISKIEVYKKEDSNVWYNWFFSTWWGYMIGMIVLLVFFFYTLDVVLDLKSPKELFHINSFADFIKKGFAIIGIILWIIIIIFIIIIAISNLSYLYDYLFK